MRACLTVLGAILMTALIGTAATTAMARGMGPAGAPNVSGPLPVPGRQQHEFHAYLNNHPDVTRELERNPSLANNPEYLKKHPELSRTINGNPSLRRRLSQDPRTVMELYRYRHEHHMGDGAGPRPTGSGGGMGRGGMGRGGTMGHGGMGPGGGMGH